MTADFSSETTEVRRQRENIYKVLGKRNCKLRILTTKKCSSGIRAKKNIFSGEGVRSKHAVEELLMEVLQALMKWYQWGIWNLRNEGRREVANICICIIVYFTAHKFFKYTGLLEAEILPLLERGLCISQST
jgi:hypothetical protein